MKLKEQFITHDSNGKQQMVDTSGNFAGLVTSNTTAAYIVELLKDDTTIDGIVAKMCLKYNAPREIIESDVKEIVDKLRSIGALNE